MSLRQTIRRALMQAAWTHWGEIPDSAVTLGHQKDAVDSVLSATCRSMQDERISPRVTSFLAWLERKTGSSQWETGHCSPSPCKRRQHFHPAPGRPPVYTPSTQCALSPSSLPSSYASTPCIACLLFMLPSRKVRKDSMLLPGAAP